MFCEFSSAFNTIQPILLKDKLEHAGVDPQQAAWVLDYLRNRPQYVRSKDCRSNTVVCREPSWLPSFSPSTLQTSHTTSPTATSRSVLMTVVSLIRDGDHNEYRGLCGLVPAEHPDQRGGKTKELVVDIRRRKHPPPTPVNIQRVDMESVDSYRYLGLHINNNMDCSGMINELYKKGQSRLFLLKTLRSFGVQGALLRTFMTLWGHQPPLLGRGVLEHQHHGC